MVKCPYCGGDTDFLTTKQVAQLLGVENSTVRYYIKQGHFPGAKEVHGLQGRGVWRIPASAVLPLLGERDGDKTT